MEKPKKKIRGLGSKIVIGIILLVVLLFVILVNFIGNFLWFKELGYVSVFLKQLVTQLKIGIPTFIVITFLTFIYLKVLKKGYYKKTSLEEVGNKKNVNGVSWFLAAVFGAIVTYFAVTKLWFNSLLFTNSVKFGLKDPIFNMDASFYLFKLEFISQVNGILIGTLFIFIIMTLLYYGILMGRTAKKRNPEPEENPFQEEDRFDGFSGSNFDHGERNGRFGPFSEIFEKVSGNIQGNMNRGQGRRRRDTISDEGVKQLFSVAAPQLIVVGVIFFLMVGFYFFLRQYDLLYTQSGAVYGAGYTDLKVTLWVYRGLMALSVVGAIALVVGIKRRKVRLIFTIPVIMILLGLAGTGVGALVQNFVVSPDEISKESKYLQRNIDFTQYAYNLDNVETKAFSAEDNLTAESIMANEATISNIRINDYQPVEKFYNQTQSIRQYYAFKDVDVDRYMINGEYTQTFLSGREIDEEKISDTWINKHLKYTHGYGVTLSQVDKVTASGQPDMLIRGIPPVSSAEEISITRPEIYFGELTNDYIVVGTDEDEFDYPDGDNNKYSRYEGSAGIKMNLINRVLFSIRERSLKLLVSSNITGDSKIIINRNIQDRVETIMPYLQYDSDPYMATVDGKLYWIVDAYTTSHKFPYSEPFSDDGKTNYIRNSVKVVIDAYNGDTDFYVVDEEDPVALTYKNIYPKLFKDIDEMPEGIKEHLRYPQNMFEIQANVYRRYHMDDVKVFYQNEDLWDISNEIYGTEEDSMTGNYYIMKIPGEEKAEFVNSIPFTPKDKKNMTGLMLARNDGEHYGELVLFQLPKSKIIYGPMQIEAQIDQSTEISKEFSLWNSSGSTYSRGNMFVIPIEDSLLYVEPVYLEATNSSIPEVKRVIVAYGDKIAYEPTLAEALNSLFGDGTVDDGSKPDDKDQDKEDEEGKDKEEELTQTELIEKCQEAYDSALEAQKAGDWAKYGEYMDELEEYLNQL